MTALLPSRCFSSYFTEIVSAEFRNPQGREENWIFGQEIPQIQSYTTYYARVCTAEIGFGILVVTSSVETVAYAILFISSHLLYPISNKPKIFFRKKLSSASFTIIWNIANASFFNFSLTNVTTNESLARHFYDNSPVGHKFKLIVEIFALSLQILSIHFSIYSTIFIGLGYIACRDSPFPVMFRYVFCARYTRPADSLYFAAWQQEVLQRHPEFFRAPRDLIPPLDLFELRINELRAAVAQGAPHEGLRVQQGAEFIGANIFPCIIDQLSKDAIIELDSASFHYLSTLSVYSFAFGSKSADAIPEFFKEETREAISNLRDGELAHGLINELSAYMHSEENIFMAINKFEEGCPENEMGRLYGHLRQAAHNEVERPGIFIGACLQRAIAQH